MEKNPEDLLSDFSVRFEGEAGADARGLTREMYQITFDSLCSTDGYGATGSASASESGRLGLFVRATDTDGTADPTFLPLEDSKLPSGAQPLTNRLRQYEGVGRFLAKSIYDDIRLPVRFNPAMFRFLSGSETGTLEDYAAFDPRAALNL